MNQNWGIMSRGRKGARKEVKKEVNVKMARGDFENMLTRRGLRATPRRVLVLNALRGAAQPLSVEAIRLLLRNKAHEVTIYRTLQTLAAVGLVIRIGLNHLREYYELAPMSVATHHHHLVCNLCGFVEDVHVSEPKDLEKDVLERSQSFKEITAHSLEFFGACRSCVSH